MRPTRRLSRASAIASRTISLCVRGAREPKPPFPRLLSRFTRSTSASRFSQSWRESLMCRNRSVAIGACSVTMPLWGKEGRFLRGSAPLDHPVQLPRSSERADHSALCSECRVERAGDRSRNIAAITIRRIPRLLVIHRTGPITGYCGCVVID